MLTNSCLKNAASSQKVEKESPNLHQKIFLGERSSKTKATQLLHTPDTESILQTTAMLAISQILKAQEFNLTTEKERPSLSQSLKTSSKTPNTQLNLSQGAEFTPQTTVMKIIILTLSRTGFPMLIRMNPIPQTEKKSLTSILKNYLLWKRESTSQPTDTMCPILQPRDCITNQSEQTLSPTTRKASLVKIQATPRSHSPERGSTRPKTVMKIIIQTLNKIDSNTFNLTTNPTGPSITDGLTLTAMWRTPTTTTGMTKILAT